MGFLGLAGKVAIVTGAGGGIGEAIVHRLIKEGCRVLAVDLDAAAMEGAFAQTDRNHLHLTTADVSSAESVQFYVDAAIKHFGCINFLANNAGIYASGELLSMPIEAFDRLMAVNLRGVFLGMQAVSRQMAAQGAGAIVNTSSIGAYRASLGYGAYNASKSAVISLTRTAARELGPKGVRVNAICPGPIDTPMLAEALQGVTPVGFAANQPLGRMGGAAEVADLVAYLLSDHAKFVTGGAYTIDGGASLTS